MKYPSGLRKVAVVSGACVRGRCKVARDTAGPLHAPSSVFTRRKKSQSYTLPRPCPIHNMAAAKWQMPLGGPPISPEDWAAFAQSHFSPEAVADFGQTFQNPAAFQQRHQQAEYNGWAEEDDLGYYEDGVTRTLTDEQIEMFRQSELRELRRLQAKGLTPQSATPQEGSANDARQSPPQRQEANVPRSTRDTTKKKKGAKSARCEAKPDLRKRTWDVVEQGLDTLDYD
ncbi:Uncharacterized protein TCAP_03635 [Tolypocladium capitatum]|uniref:Uncharacterized protein n=1 Tax=Tolypocladium capitatum TaxID=45235 RepID=A0A2K3QFW7_9HYPO|nr:Uncharacterized protein TCAP_03635 [Tolypocladium capitatum]